METQVLDIPVLWPDYYEDCDQCTERLQEALMEMHGMRKVGINVDRRTLQVSYDKDLLTFEEIKDYAQVLGVTVTERYKHESVQIIGLDCPDCASKLETAIRRMKGVAWASLNYATSRLIVEYEQQRVSFNKIAGRVRSFGYDIEEKERVTPFAKKFRFFRSARLTLTVISGILLATGWIAWMLGAGTPITSSLFIASALTGGIFAARSGLLSLAGLSLDTNFLMTAAAVGAVWLGEYSEAAAVMFLFSLGSTLEAFTVDKTRRSIKSLIDAFPTHASIKRDGSIKQVPLEEVEIGEHVLIKPGEKIPVDGRVIDGESAVNESPVTGESVPRSKLKGDTVYAGSINGRGSLEVRTTNRAEDNTISRIVHMVEEAQAQKAPSQRFSETFGRYYTPCVITLAVLVAALGPVLLGGTFDSWLKTALTLLVVSCPCALVISTPVAIVAAIGNAARQGVLIKGGAHLEALGDVNIVAFDKTGTLTNAKLKVCDVIPFNSHTPEEVMRIAASVESRSEHPLAEAIVSKAQEMELEELHVSFFEALPGKGARAVVNGGVYYVGSRRLLEEYSVDIPESDAITDLITKGTTVIFVANETSLLGAIGAVDTVKARSAETITLLKRAGIDETVMLTGDTRQTARAVALLLGIDREYAELLPEDKLSRIRDMITGRNKVAMVGDGINDAPALAAANVGIAMGGAGSHAAIEAADVALMADELIMLPYAITLSRKAKRIIQQNIALALFAVLILVGGALLKWVTLTIGVIGHEGSALLVIANSMRLLKTHTN